MSATFHLGRHPIIITRYAGPATPESQGRDRIRYAIMEPVVMGGCIDDLTRAELTELRDWITEELFKPHEEEE